MDIHKELRIHFNINSHSNMEKVLGALPVSDIDKATALAFPYLMESIQQGRLKMMRSLLKFVDPSIQDHVLLQCAVSHNQLNMVKVLHPLCKSDADKMLAINLAIDYNHKDILKFLLEQCSSRDDVLLSVLRAHQVSLVDVFQDMDVSAMITTHWSQETLDTQMCMLSVLCKKNSAASRTKCAILGSILETFHNRPQIVPRHSYDQRNHAFKDNTNQSLLSYLSGLGIQSDRKMCKMIIDHAQKTKNIHMLLTFGQSLHSMEDLQKTAYLWQMKNLTDHQSRLSQEYPNIKRKFKG